MSTTSLSRRCACVTPRPRPRRVAPLALGSPSRPGRAQPRQRGAARAGASEGGDKVHRSQPRSFPPCLDGTTHRPHARFPTHAGATGRGELFLGGLAHTPTLRALPTQEVARAKDDAAGEGESSATPAPPQLSAERDASGRTVIRTGEGGALAAELAAAQLSDEALAGLADKETRKQQAAARVEALQEGLRELEASATVAGALSAEVDAINAEVEAAEAEQRARAEEVARLTREAQAARAKLDEARAAKEGLEAGAGLLALDSSELAEFGKAAGISAAAGAAALAPLALSSPALAPDALSAAVSLGVSAGLFGAAYRLACGRDPESPVARLVPLACLTARALAYSDAALVAEDGGLRLLLSASAIFQYGFETLAVQLALREGIVKLYPMTQDEAGGAK